MRYSLYPDECQVPGVTRATAEMALRLASKLLAIKEPGLKWFRRSRSGEKVLVESSLTLWGFSNFGASSVDWNAYVSGDLGPRPAYKTTCHECFHLARTKPGKPKAGATEEAEAEEFSERTTRTYFDQRWEIYKTR